MKRDWELIRAILLRLEESNRPNAVVKASAFPDIPEQEVNYNISLLRNDGYIEASILESKPGGGIYAATAQRLTNHGHDLLDSIRKDSVWDKIKEKFKTNDIDMTYDLVLTFGKEIIKKSLM
ncbi:MAG: DUF2513 domain-containing protein [Planctomycetes bacterium]|nr:DUF2513 domain-containing protein [Planctomycetota bacterium]